MDAVARGAAAHHRLRPASAVEGAGGVCAPRGRDAAAPGGEPAVGHGGAADFEQAGRVSGLTAFPPAAAIAATKSADFAQTKARHLGAEARALGIRMLLGPSAEDPLAAAEIDGYHYSKVAVCVKRFPDPGVGPLCGRAEALLIGHEVVPESDEEQIASLSRTEIQGVLRRERRIVGIAVTDERSRLW